MSLSSHHKIKFSPMKWKEQDVGKSSAIRLSIHKMRRSSVGRYQGGTTVVLQYHYTTNTAVLPHVTGQQIKISMQKTRSYQRRSSCEKLLHRRLRVLEHLFLRQASVDSLLFAYRYESRSGLRAFHRAHRLEPR